MGDIKYLIIHSDTPLSPTGINSGAEMATRCLARTLAARGERVVVAAQLEGEECTVEGVEFWDLGPGYDVGSALVRARSLGQYYLISAGRALSLLQSRGEERCLARILISHDRSGNDTGIKPGVLSQVADRVVFVSEAQRAVFLKAGLKAEKTSVLYNGVMLDLFKAGVPEKRNFNRLIFVGALIEDKGIHWLINSYCELKAKYPALTLDVYGSASLWGREKLFDEKALEAKVPGLRFHGKVSQQEIAEAYATAGLCVIPSIWFDPFPLVSLEAQACGCPVFAFDVGGLKEGIFQGETGIVSAEVTPQSLTKNLDQLLSSPQRLLEMSKKALEKCRTRFTWEKVAEGISSLCAGVSLSPVQASALVRGRVGVVSTWNQDCGLAEYGRFMLEAWPSGSYMVFGETSEKLTQIDEPWVKRCWNRTSPNYSLLVDEVLKSGVKVLLLNCQARFFQYPAFGAALETLRTRGVKVIAFFHNIFSIDSAVQQLAGHADLCLIHSRESRLELIAQGVAPERIFVIPHGVKFQEARTEERIHAARKKLGIPPEAKVLSSFGFVQAHKGIEGLIEAVAQLRARGISALGYVVGATREDDPTSAQYLQALKNHASKMGVSAFISFTDRFVEEKEANEYLYASDLVFMNYRSQYYEASGACARALGAGSLVACSLAPAFAPFSDAVWHITAGFPAALSAELLVTNEALRGEILSNARRYCEENSWTRIAEKFFSLLRSIGIEVSATETRTDSNAVIAWENRAVEKDVNQNVSASLRVLMQNRSNAWTQPGGDTVVMERLVEGLRAMGVQVTVDLEGKVSPTGFDLVHLFNFATPDITKWYAERAVQAGVPFVVTALCEDVPSFHAQSRVAAQVMTEYVSAGRDKNWLKNAWGSVNTVAPVTRFQNDWVAERAACLLASGKEESQVLKRDYPALKRVVEVPFGFEIPSGGEAELFVKEFGIRDFVLCVGRIESRKNQLMLLKALEDSELPVVLVGGGFSYQPDYDQAVRNLRRKGATIVLGRLSPQQLAGAYQACRIHALPSWYELPGLVTLEAASFGKNVVVGRKGTIEDYLGERAFYCAADDERSIRNAVMAAYYSPVPADLAAQARSFTWQQCVAKTLEIYREVALRRAASQPSVALSSQAPAAPYKPFEPVSAQPNESEFLAVLEKGEAYAKENKFVEAHQELSRAEMLNPKSARALRARGAVYLAESKAASAKSFFERALQLDARDPKSLCGLGMCEMGVENYARANQYFAQALTIDPMQLTALNQMVRCAYALQQFGELEKAIRFYLEKNPSDVEFRFCLAGCLFKQERKGEALAECSEILRRSPSHRGAIELRELLSREQTAPVATTVTEIKDEMPQAPSWLTPAAAQSVAVAVASKPEKTSLSSAAKQVSDPLADAFEASFSSIEELKRVMKFDEAATQCEELFRRPTLTPAQKDRTEVLRAEIQVMRGEIEAADAGFDAVIARNPQSARAHCGKGALAAYRGNWEEAKKRFNLAKNIEPENDVAYAGLGLCATRAGEKEAAWSYYVKATTHNPENLRAILGLVELSYPLKRLTELEKVLRNYLDMHPADLRFLYSLAGCLYAQNKMGEARAEVEKIIIFDPANAKAIELKQLIDRSLQSSGDTGQWNG